jgi:hypothetical protein
MSSAGVTLDRKAALRYHAVPVFQFRDSAVLPLLQARSPKTVIEVGARDGGHTRLIAAWAAEHGATLHVIDPKPNFDIDAYVTKWAGHLVIHCDLSLRALAPIGPVDMVLLDGDHNWYTVMNELQEIDRINSDWPLVLMHDVGWPYGRRDMYHQPETVPAEYRQPHRRGAMRPFHSALTERGINGEVINAEREGGPRNGVLTAVEDFLSLTDRELLLFARPGVGGFGIIASGDALQDDAKLASAVASVHNPEYAVRISPVYATREFGDASVSPAQPWKPRGRLLTWLRRLRRAQRRLRRGLRPVPRP